jgi:hypothetical protein
MIVQNVIRVCLVAEVVKRAVWHMKRSVKFFVIDHQAFHRRHRSVQTRLSACVRTYDDRVFWSQICRRRPDKTGRRKSTKASLRQYRAISRVTP